MHAAGLERTLKFRRLPPSKCACTCSMSCSVYDGSPPPAAAAVAAAATALLPLPGGDGAAAGCCARTATSCCAARSTGERGPSVVAGSPAYISCARCTPSELLGCCPKPRSTASRGLAGWLDPPSSGGGELPVGRWPRGVATVLASRGAGEVGLWCGGAVGRGAPPSALRLGDGDPCCEPGVMGDRREVDGGSSGEGSLRSLGREGGGEGRRASPRAGRGGHVLVGTRGATAARTPRDGRRGEERARPFQVAGGRLRVRAWCAWCACAWCAMGAWSSPTLDASNPPTPPSRIDPSPPHTPHPHTIPPRN